MPKKVDLQERWQKREQGRSMRPAPVRVDYQAKTSTRRETADSLADQLASALERNLVTVGVTREEIAEFLKVTEQPEKNMTTRDPWWPNAQQNSVPYRDYERALERAENAEVAREQLQRVVDAVNQQPCSYVTVLGRADAPDKWVVRRGHEMLEVTAPMGLIIGKGQTVRVVSQTMNILGIVDSVPVAGELTTVSALVDDDNCEVAQATGTRVVLTGGRKVAVGDRVVLDGSSTVVLKNLGRTKAAQAVSTDTGVTWDDIGGQDEAKRAMREAIEGPVLRKEIYERYGRKPTKGVLLFGPPGNGKTMLGKAAASALARLHGASAGSGFLYVKGPELLTMWVGGTEQNVRQLFESARRHKAEHGYPAVIFIDEAEAILGKRGGHGSVLSGTTVPMFLSEMDGLTDSGAMVLLATNRSDSLDSAIVREGRIDRKVLVARPSSIDAAEIFGRHFRGRPIASDVDVDALIEVAVESLYDTSRALYRVHLSAGVPKTFTLAHLTSGAQIARIVDAAASEAIERELTGGEPGIRKSDVCAAVLRTFEETRHLDHHDELSLFCQSVKGTVTGYERIGESKEN